MGEASTSKGYCVNKLTIMAASLPDTLPLEYILHTYQPR
jgi:hypothetical protein